MTPLRTAVIGAGYLGRFHAEKYAQQSHSQLIAVVDPRAEAREALATQLGVRAIADHRDILGEVDAVSIVTTTPHHFAIAQDCLNAGVHVLVEKPITETVAEAEALIQLAAQRERILQVGHLERFNPAILAAEPYLRGARFIECQRLAPFKERGTDVNVVLDLMIHDIDIVQSVIGQPIESIDAIGTPVFSGAVDIANARIRFVGGCVANVTASRVSLKSERKLRAFRDDSYVSIDLQQRILTRIEKREGKPSAAGLPVNIEEQSFEQGDALKAEIEHFLSCIVEGRTPWVTGEDGKRALETATRITEAVKMGLMR
jgi:predicted dehydrogenase